MVQKDRIKEPVPVVGGMAWTVNGASTRARHMVAVFQALCSLYGLTCVGYAQNSLEFISRSSLINVVDRSFCVYTDSLFAEIGDSNDMLFLVGGWMFKRRRNARCTVARMQNIFCSQLTLLQGCVLGESSSDGIWNFRTSSLECYVDHSHTVYS